VSEEASVKIVNSVAWQSVKTVGGVTSHSVKKILGIAAGGEEQLENTYSVASTNAEDPGRGGYISIANPSSYHMVDGEGDDKSFSVSMWVKMSALPYYRFFCKGANNDNEYVATTWSGAGTALLWKLSGNAAGTTYIQQYTTHGMSAGTWYNVVFVYTAGVDPPEDGLSFWVDGERVGDAPNGSGAGGRSQGGTYGAMQDSGDNLEIFRQNGNSNLSDGWVDETGYWTKALSESEISEIYNNGTPGNLATHSGADNLLSWWRMGDTDDGTGTTVTDVQGTGNGTLSGTPAAFVEVVPGS
jgi:hypothetical protein